MDTHTHRAHRNTGTGTGTQAHTGTYARTCRPYAGSIDYFTLDSAAFCSVAVTSARLTILIQPQTIGLGLPNIGSAPRLHAVIFDFDFSSVPLSAFIISSLSTLGRGVNSPSLYGGSRIGPKINSPPSVAAHLSRRRTASRPHHVATSYAAVRPAFRSFRPVTPLRHIHPDHQGHPAGYL